MLRGAVHLLRAVGCLLQVSWGKDTQPGDKNERESQLAASHQDLFSVSNSARAKSHSHVTNCCEDFNTLQLMS